MYIILDSKGLRRKKLLSVQDISDFKDEFTKNENYCLINIVTHKQYSPIQNAWLSYPDDDAVIVDTGDMD